LLDPVRPRICAPKWLDFAGSIQDPVAGGKPSQLTGIKA